MPLVIIRNDITKMAVDAIVNATDCFLSGSGGVDREIHRAAGAQMELACQQLDGCYVGEAKITAGYDLPCKYVIHTVGPIWCGGDHDERRQLAACYQNALRLAAEYHCETVAFPLVASGTYGFPKDQVIRIAANTIQDFLLVHDMTVYLVVYDRESFGISAKLFANITQYIDDHYIADHQRKNSIRADYAEALMEESMRSSRLEDLPFPVDACNAPPLKSAKRGLLHRVKKQAEPLGAPLEHDTVCSAPTPNLEELLSHLDEGFREMLLRKINEKGMTDAECYKKANIDRKLFNKIKNQPDYRPGKPTVAAFAIALELPLEEAKDMLSKAGYSLSHSSKFDLIIEYFLQQGNYDIFEINEALFAFDQSLLGNGVA